MDRRNESRRGVPSGSTATPQAFRVAIQHAINAGNDTDTIAAITGALARAMVWVDAIPLGWQRMLHGWGAADTVLSAGELMRLAADASANAGDDRPGPYQPRRTRHPPTRATASTQRRLWRPSEDEQALK